MVADLKLSLLRSLYIIFTSVIELLTRTVFSECYKRDSFIIIIDVIDFIQEQIHTNWKINLLELKNMLNEMSFGLKYRTDLTYTY